MVTLTTTQTNMVIWEEDAHLTRVLGMWMPKTRGYPYQCNSGFSSPSHFLREKPWVRVCSYASHTIRLLCGGNSSWQEVFGFEFEWLKFGWMIEWTSFVRIHTVEQVFTLSNRISLPKLPIIQGVQFLFFPIFSYFLSLVLFSPIFRLKPPIFPIF